MELPEPVVDAVDPDAAGTPAAVLRRHDSRKNRQRSDRRECPLKSCLRTQVQGELLAEEPRRDDGVIGAAEALENGITQTATHRVAHQERTSEHCNGRRHADHNRRIRAPVVGQSAYDQLARSHGATSTG